MSKSTASGVCFQNHVIPHQTECQADLTLAARCLPWLGPLVKLMSWLAAGSAFRTNLRLTGSCLVRTKGSSASPQAACGACDMPKTDMISTDPPPSEAAPLRLVDPPQIGNRS